MRLLHNQVNVLLIFVGFKQFEDVRMVLEVINKAYQSAHNFYFTLKPLFVADFLLVDRFDSSNSLGSLLLGFVNHAEGTFPEGLNII